MAKDEILDPPNMSLFWIFGTYGVALILILTSLFWKWSGMASIGAFASILFGPIIMITAVAKNFKKMKQSVYHKLVIYLSIGYMFMMAATFIVANLH